MLVAFVVGHTLATRTAEDARPDYAGLDPAAFPHVRAAAHLLARHDPDREFELGLDAMLEGLAGREMPR